MSVDATRWAWSVEINNSTKRLVLLSLADRAGEEHTCFPSTKRVVKDTCLDRKTVLKAITELIEDGFILDTGERKGNGVRVLKLIGVLGRENEIYPKKITSPKIGTSAEIGITTDPKIGTATDPKIGTQNLKENLKRNLTIDIENQFNKFWSIVPNKDGKATARKSFEKALKKKSVDDLIAAYKANISYCDSVKRFYRNPSTWLNQEGWDDESIKPFINQRQEVIKIDEQPVQQVKVQTVKKSYL